MEVRPTIRMDGILLRGLGTIGPWAESYWSVGMELVLLRLVRGDGVIDIWGWSY